MTAAVFHTATMYSCIIIDAWVGCSVCLSTL